LATASYPPAFIGETTPYQPVVSRSWKAISGLSNRTNFDVTSLLFEPGQELVQA